MKIWCISDTHERHNELKIPNNIDLVIFAGDEANSSNPVENYSKSLKFFEWYDNLDVQYKIFVPGNHSTAVESGLITNDMFPNIIFLIHTEFSIEGYKIFGSPYTPAFGKSWSYMKKRSRLSEVWSTIPDDTDILITHGPPKGILDLTTDTEDRYKIAQVGCKSLYSRVSDIRPRLHVFGHIHSEKKFHNNGMLLRDKISFVNASCCNNHKHEINNGLIVHL